MTGALDLAELSHRTGGQWPFFPGRLGAPRDPRIKSLAVKQLQLLPDYQNYSTLTARCLAAIILAQDWGKSDDSKAALKNILLEEKPYDWGAHIPALMSLVAFHTPKDPDLIQLFSQWLLGKEPYLLTGHCFNFLYAYLRNAGDESIGKKMLLAYAKKRNIAKYNMIEHDLAMLISNQNESDGELLDTMIHVAFDIHNERDNYLIDPDVLANIFLINQDLNSLLQFTAEAPWRSSPQDAISFIHRYALAQASYDPNDEQGCLEEFLNLLDNIETSFPENDYFLEAVRDARSRLNE
ncbi:MAG: hypothetical protein HOM34_09050 [Planctomycetes bacterium]|jgi:hypothetical protein|nr:hypothetical protein [Planctomycetota bacterium]MBT4559847.1 hypothetical protein [Planctomycetota bacterium]MBT5120855.1 hypothetical protein [Planctomycetota bacterium]MBT7011288.1 hypothetical protein [Planctomycetota bacterium]